MRHSPLNAALCVQFFFVTAFSLRFEKLNQLFVAAGLNYFGFYLNSGTWLKCREYNRINVFGWFGNRPLSQR